MYHYLIGLDLGQSSDYTALALVEEPLWVSGVGWEDFDVYLDEELAERGWISPADVSPLYAARILAVNYKYGRPAQPPLYVRHLERYELGTKYTEIITKVKRLLLQDPIRQRLERSRLLVDKTGVGAAVIDGFRQAGVNPFAITIHGGSQVTQEYTDFRVPKRDLVSAVQTVLQSGRLKIAEDLELAPLLRKELLNFRVKIDPRTAHDSYEHWREGDHDDLVLAVALAVWYREYRSRDIEKRNAEQGGFRMPGVPYQDFEFRPRKVNWAV